jgi:hypothetical protein
VPDLSSITPVAVNARRLGGAGPVVQDVEIPRVFSPWDISVVYWLGDRTCFSATPQRIDSGRVGASTDDGWRFTMNVSRDIDSLRVRLGIDPFFCAMDVRAGILDNQWTPPDDVFDPEVLALPASLSNVGNGYGFFGSIGLLQHDWQVSDELNALLGF